MIAPSDALPASAFAWKEGPSSEGRPVMVVTGGPVMAGRIQTHGTRLVDTLNDIDTSYIRVSDVGLFASTENRLITKLRHCMLPKPKLKLAVIFDEQHEAADKRPFRLVKKDVLPVFLTVHGCEVRGNFPMPRVGEVEPDPIWVLTHQTLQFFPVIGASVYSVCGNRAPFQVPVVIVNSDAVSLFSVGVASKGRSDLND